MPCLICKYSNYHSYCEKALAHELMYMNNANKKIDKYIRVHKGGASIKESGPLVQRYIA